MSNKTPWNRIQGSIVALMTPMTQSGALDFEALDRLIDFHIQNKTDAIVIAGTTGESATLTPAESEDLIGYTVARIAGRMPVIAGTGTNSTEETIRETRAAQYAGADACLLVTPYYNHPTQEGLYCHYMAVADAVDMPQILYNVPSRTCVDLQPETVARLSAHPNIMGIKDATGSLRRAADIMEACPSGFMFYSGDDATGCEACLMGGNGVVSVTANVVPDLMHMMCVAAIAGNNGTAKAIDSQLETLHQDLFIETNPIPVKWMLAEMGMIEPNIRLPLTWLSAKHEPILANTLRQIAITSRWTYTRYPCFRKSIKQCA